MGPTSNDRVTAGLARVSHGLRARWTATSNQLRLRSFRWSSHARTWRTLAGRYGGRRCVIVGNGPSLCTNDLEAIAHTPSFGFNRIHHVFDRTTWRPTFYCSEDPRMLAGCIDAIDRLDVPYKFIPFPLELWYGLRISGATCFLLDTKGIRPGPESFRPDPLRGFRWGGTVAFTAMQIAVHLGFTDIVLVGIDHRFSRSTNDRGELLVEQDVRDYFDPAYDHDRHLLDVPNLERSTRAYVAARQWADLHGIRIRNATRGGNLEVFERVDLDALDPPLAKDDGQTVGSR